MLFRSEIDKLSHPDNWRSMESYDIQKMIKRAGHDAFYTGEDGVKNLSVYDPRFIKSAIGNRGTYDTSNPDITKKSGGTIKDHITITERPL